MAKFTKDEFISGLKEMTILEVKELVDAMKEEFGVDPSAVAVAAAPAAAEEAAAAEKKATKAAKEEMPAVEKTTLGDIDALSDLKNQMIEDAKAALEAKNK